MFTFTSNNSYERPRRSHGTSLVDAIPGNGCELHLTFVRRKISPTLHVHHLPASMAIATAADLQPVANATKKLHVLLDKARAVKAASTVDPPLPTSPFLEDVNALQDGLGEAYDQTHKYGVLETAARDTFYSLIAAAQIQDPAFVEVWNLLDILILCSDQGQATPELACWLIEELLDSQTTHGCRTVFDYLESRRERLAQKDFHKKNLVFLRSCNELLRRLSRAEDAIFCGRVFFFLFQTFPLGDKSSVNLRGEFHVENTTKFEVAESGSTQDGDKMEVDAEPAKPESETPKPATPQPGSKPASKAITTKAPPKKEEELDMESSDLYPIFWRLQQDFSEPTRLFAQEHFQRFKQGLAHTIAKFKKTTTVVQALASEGTKRGFKRKLHEDNAMIGDAASSDDQFADQYNPKYLTSRDLFDLELSDQSFQRHVLVQSLILIDFLLSLTEKAKKRVTALGNSNKSMLYSFTLSDEDSKWAKATREMISAYLSTSPDGKLFNRMVDTVLARDKNWIRWKVESCPSIVRDPISTLSEFEAREGTKMATRMKQVPHVTRTAVGLSFLVEDSNEGFDTLKNSIRFTETPWDELRAGVETSILDLQMETEGTQEYARVREDLDRKEWRVVRRLRAQDLGGLNKVDPETGLEKYFKSVDSEGVQRDIDAVEGEVAHDVREEMNIVGGENVNETNGSAEETSAAPAVLDTEELRKPEDIETQPNVVEEASAAT